MLGVVEDFENSIVGIVVVVVIMKREWGIKGEVFVEGLFSFYVWKYLVLK